MSFMATDTFRRSGTLNRRRFRHWFDSGWRTAQRKRRIMVRAVHEAEQGVVRAREHDAPMGELPVLVQELRVVSAEVDRFLLVQAYAHSDRRSFERAIRLAASVTAASTRIDYAASNLVERPHNPRARSIATSVALEASSILDGLAATLMNDPDPVCRPPVMVP
jgi:hypothetical protein